MWSPLPLFHIAAMLPLVAAISVGATYLGMQHFEPGALAPDDRPERRDHDFRAVRALSAGDGAAPEIRVDGLLQGEAHEQLLRRPAEERQRRLPSGDAAHVAARHLRHDGSRRHRFHRSLRDGSRARIHPPGHDPDRRRRAHRRSGQRPRVPNRGARRNLLEGFSISDGYYRDPEKNDSAFDAEGWFHTGDLGSIDDSGHIMFHGRTQGHAQGRRRERRGGRDRGAARPGIRR